MADSSFGNHLTIETWSLYSVRVLAIGLRLASRCSQYGLRRLQIDDYIMVDGLVWYTLLCISLNQIVHGGGSNLMTAEDIAALTPQIKAERVRGSKWVFFSEHCMILTLWSMKICMVMLYSRLTNGLKQQIYVKGLAAWIVLSFIGSELALFLTCRPLPQYWAVPAENSQCSTYQYYEIVEACMNIPGDLAMLTIAIPLLASLQLPTRQKAILILIFGMGGFIIVAAIITKLYCLVPSLISYDYINWYFREASVAVYVTNLPATWPLILRLFPRLEKWTTQSRTRESSSRYKRSKGSRSAKSAKSSKLFKLSRSGAASSHGHSKHASLGYFSQGMISNEIGRFDGLESREHINKPSKVWTAEHEEQIALEIYRQVTVSLSSSRRDSKEFDVELAIRAQISRGS